MCRSGQSYLAGHLHHVADEESGPGAFKTHALYGLVMAPGAPTDWKSKGSGLCNCSEEHRVTRGSKMHTRLNRRLFEWTIYKAR